MLIADINISFRCAETTGGFRCQCVSCKHDFSKKFSKKNIRDCPIEFREYRFNTSINK